MYACLQCTNQFVLITHLNLCFNLTFLTSTCACLLAVPHDKPQPRMLPKQHVQHGALPLNFAHDPDFFKLLRAVRWYGAASVPQGNNPTSSRYVSSYTPQPPADAAAAAAAATASCDAGANTAGIGSNPVAAATSSKRAERASSSSGGGAGGWIKAHMPHLRSRAAAVAGAAAQPGSSAVTTPESLAAAAGSSATAAAASHKSSSRAASPAGSAVSSESAAMQAAAASLAREAVKAVVARAAAEAAAEDGSGCDLQAVAAAAPSAAAAAGVGPVVRQAREPVVSPVGLKPRGAAPVTPVGGPSPGGFRLYAV